MKILLLLIITLTILSCSTDTVAQFELEIAFPNLTFFHTVDLQNPGDGSNRLFVVEQPGRIFVFQNYRTVSEKNLFLDIQDRVNDSGSEEGLLGLAFHPNYPTNGYFFVYYTAANPRRTVVARYRVSQMDSNTADNNSEWILLEINQPFSNHNGGQIAFGLDGYLYIGVGDGGAGGDPFRNAQNRASLVGNLLRIDVDTPSGGNNYGIPPDNPFIGNTQGYKEEIYAYGLRNPWRFSFDRVTGRLWAADVGQNRFEEIDLIQKGKNYGWDIAEGFHCFEPSSDCDTTGLETPIWEYDHDVGASITGGFVYRGPSVPELTGTYIYGDFISGRIWSLKYEGISPPENVEILNTPLNISSFGIDAENELFICDYNGKIYRFKSTVTKTKKSSRPLPGDVHLTQNYPNPFNPTTTIPFSTNANAHFELRIINLRGQVIKILLSQRLGAGRYSINWNGKNSEGFREPSGMYFYQLLMNHKILSSRRMVLLK